MDNRAKCGIFFGPLCTLPIKAGHFNTISMLLGFNFPKSYFKNALEPYSRTRTSGIPDSGMPDGYRGRYYRRVLPGILEASGSTGRVNDSNKTYTANLTN